VHGISLLADLPAARFIEELFLLDARGASMSALVILVLIEDLATLCLA
jgi:hypothetical protein